jgi:hypothetical protein
MFGGSEWLFPAVVDRELPMSQAPQAHRVMAAGERVGQISLLAT